MEAVRLFKSLDRNQRNTFFACFLGWALDAFDFFLLTFVISRVHRAVLALHSGGSPLRLLQQERDLLGTSPDLLADPRGMQLSQRAEELARDAAQLWHASQR